MIALVVLTAGVLPQFALAQYQDAGAKIRGDVYWRSRASRHYIESGRNYAREVQSYMSKVTKPEPSLVKDVKTELGRYLENASAHLAEMKKDFAGDKETVAAIEGIEKGLNTAIEHNKAMIACCENEKFDKIATMSCCSDLVKQLEKVYADHVALMNKLTAAPAAKK
jgi:hypothetical protein